MSDSKIIKETALRIYQGLMYWFLWASFVTLRDEMFCSYALNQKSTQSENVRMIESPVQLATVSAESLLVVQFENLIHATTDSIKSFLAPVLANLRALAEAAKDLPERHRARLRFSSD